MVLRKKKGKSGVKKAFITRRKAMQKLQLNLKDFRRICILKGVYPVEPKNMSKIKGGGSNKTYYLLKDIQYLSHEPIIWKFWSFKIFLRKVSKSKGRRDFDRFHHLRDHQEFYKLDHIVKERYPTFIDALRDIDDALSMCFLFSNFTKSKVAPKELIELSRRLTLEFMYYVIETKALRKVFISIKGYYYQAEIMGQTINWVVPHKFVFKNVYDVDFRIMRTFTDFYVTLLGFVNYKLYSSQKLIYPPKLSSMLSKEDAEYMIGEEDVDFSYELMSALNIPLVKQIGADIEDEIPDEFEDADQTGESFHELVKFQSLFNGLKFFISREVPRESLAFIINCFGGEVSWDRTTCIGSTYEEGNEEISHQIIDREVIANKYMNRYYVQPQWVYDCVNARRLINVDEYFPGLTLPAHLSPFVEEKAGEYVPPEKLAFLKQEYENEKKEDSDYKEDKDEIYDLEEEKEEPQVSKMKVKPGKLEKVNKRKKEKDEKAEEKRLAVMMIPKKNKRLYDKIMFGKKRKAREAKKLKQKREEYDKLKKEHF